MFGKKKLCVPLLKFWTSGTEVVFVLVLWSSSNAPYSCFVYPSPANLLK